MTPMDEGRKRVLGSMAAIMTARHCPERAICSERPAANPETDKLISASVQWARKIMEKIDRTLMD